MRACKVTSEQHEQNCAHVSFMDVCVCSRQQYLSKTDTGRNLGVGRAGWSIKLVGRVRAVADDTRLSSPPVPWFVGSLMSVQQVDCHPVVAFSTEAVVPGRASPCAAASGVGGEKDI